MTPPKPESTARQSLLSKLLSGICPPVFIGSSLIIFILLAVASLYIREVEGAMDSLHASLTKNVGWFYVLVVNITLATIIYLFFSPAGKIRLGGKNATKAFSTKAWFAMLFSAGMGIGLVFYGVAEPILHYDSPPFANIRSQSPDAASTAMRITFFHWGLHAWGLYALVGLSLAYFSFNRGLPLTIRSGFYPIFGNSINGLTGHAIDTVATVATLFGVATSLGLGVSQISAGLGFVYDVPQSIATQLVLIAVITAVATISVVSGLDKGIKLISVGNLILASLLALLVFLAGPTITICRALIQNTGGYLQDFLKMATWTSTYRNSSWQEAWTLFYWAWWIAWAPFVGMFIARISKGRTIREFIGGVLIVPPLVTFIWMAIFGNAAIFEQMQGAGTIVEAVSADVSTALFVLLQGYPLAWLTSTLAILVIIFFFVTSSDSGSLVIDTITSGGNPNPPIPQRIYWAVLEGIVAAALLLTGGLQALQLAAISAALPFSLLLCLLCISLVRALSKDTSKNAPSSLAS